jgi:predicted ATPase
VVFVDLALLHDAELVLPTIAHSLGVKEAVSEGLRETLHAYLRKKHLLLVLDNLEQVLGAAPAVAKLVVSSDGLCILVTSRAPLRVSGEQEYPVRPLATPDMVRIPYAEDLAGNPAVELFVERARNVLPDFTLSRTNAAAVAAICRRLDGLPLALELAAARLRVMSPSDLLGRLDRSLPLLTHGSRDLPERQRTMRAVIEWSYQLLSESDWRLLNRLAVFQGGWDLEAAEAVGAGWDIIDEEVLDLLSALVEQSLVVAAMREEGGARFRMLVPVREYAEARLELNGEAEETRRRHAGYYLVQAQTAEEELAGPGQLQWLERLDRENDNLRTTLSWALKHDTDTAVRVVGSLRRFWEARGLIGEGRAWLDAALAATSGRDLPARPKALSSSGWMAYWHGDPERALSSFEESAALCRRLGDDEGLVVALDGMGSVLLNMGDPATAAPLLEEGVAVARELRRPQPLARVLATMGVAVAGLGDHERAGALIEESLATARRLGDHSGAVRSLYTIGALALELGEVGRARAAMEEALPLLQDLGDHLGVVHALDHGAVVAAMQSQAERAVQLWAAADGLREAIGSRRLPIYLRFEALIDGVRTCLDEESYERAWAEGAQMGVERAVEFALSDTEGTD